MLFPNVGFGFRYSNVPDVKGNGMLFLRVLSLMPVFRWVCLLFDRVEQFDFFHGCLHFLCRIGIPRLCLSTLGFVQLRYIKSDLIGHGRRDGVARLFVQLGIRVDFFGFVEQLVRKSL